MSPFYIGFIMARHKEKEIVRIINAPKALRVIKNKTKKAKPVVKKVKIAKGKLVPKAVVKKMRKRAGGSNVGEYTNVKATQFAGPKGGAPQGSYPINTLSRAKSALKLAHNAPDPMGIKRAVYKKYPKLRPSKKSAKLG
jgi:hypothetical protein